ncbi:LLM class flavin-dependent oxidoreductase [Pseudonocardia nematodicida]|uniref:LLM class flavin-dependent oxidoreductase n=1 Tax=Pseudonocardia nematodicida TaxID=1206997 RepID=A0ABV1K843_9PSEU
MTRAAPPPSAEPNGRAGMPLFNEQPLKLGLFGINCSGGLTMTEAETTYEVTWEHTSKIAKKADEVGFEALIPIARWKGFGGSTDFNGTAFETYTWAAALAAQTENIAIVATSHLPTVHPIVAAKQAATIDHVSGGRFALNLVMGWFTSEMEMFGVVQRGRTDRYAFGDEWLGVVRDLWTSDDPVDFAGEYVTVADAVSKPRPLQQPHPVLINAGNSPAGLDFSARNVDINFAAAHTLDDARTYSARIRDLAWREYRRSMSVMMSAFVICRDTEEEARQVRAHILEKGDYVGARNLATTLGMQSSSFDSQVSAGLDPFVLSFGAYTIVGTPEQVASQLVDLSRAGIDGVALAFLDYLEELTHFDENVMPLLREAGIRR